MKRLQAVRGMNDILPTMSEAWRDMEERLIKFALQYGYQEIRIPVVEFTELFARSIGEVTDIVEKEMYTFNDRNGDSLTLRPEGTAGCIRAGIEHSLFYNQVQRLFYLGPMFRHERPQKGRYRQFHQLGVEAYGLAGPDIDMEMFLLAMKFWQEFDIADKVELQINTLGDVESRAKYRKDLVQYFSSNMDSLDPDSKRRLTTNPLRILDSKDPAMQELIFQAPKILDYLDSKAKLHFKQLCDMLEQFKLPYVVNPCLVRGLDYYCSTVFEWVVKSSSGAQKTICAGGHYDRLVAIMGGKATPAIGFALGLERLFPLIMDKLALTVMPTIYLIFLGESVVTKGLMIAEEIRKLNRYRVIVNCGGGTLKSQLKKADKSGAELAFILGANELNAQKILVKYLREPKPQQEVALDRIINFLTN